MIVVPQIAVTAQHVAAVDGGDAFEIARTFVSQGAEALQLRAIDSASATSPENLDWLEQVAKAAGVPVQFDGAIAGSQALERVARRGFASIVLSMEAIFDPLLVRWALDLLGDRLVIEICADGDGLFGAPASSADMEVIELAHQLRVQGVERLLIRDVTGVSLPINMLRRLCDEARAQVSFSGLVTSLEDIRQLSRISRTAMEAVIVGEPLYDGRINVGEATKISR